MSAGARARATIMQCALNRWQALDVKAAPESATPASGGSCVFVGDQLVQVTNSFYWVFSASLQRSMSSTPRVPQTHAYFTVRVADQH